MKQTLSIRITGKERKQRILHTMHQLAHFRNMLILLNNIYKEHYGKWILTDSFLYALLTNKHYNSKKQEKINEFNNILANINQISKLKEFRDNLKKLKNDIKNSELVQSTIRQLIDDYKSYTKTMQAYNKNKSKFKGMPKPPKTRKLKNIMSFTLEFVGSIFEIIENEKGKYILLKLSKNKEKYNYIKIKLPKDFDSKKISSVRLKAIGTDIYADIVYDVNIELNAIDNINKQYIAGIDLGLDNLATIFSTNEKLRTFIIDGKEIKAFNQWYNKQLAKLKSELDCTNNQIVKIKKENENADVSMHEQKIIALQNKIKQLNAHRYRWLHDAMHQITRKIADVLYATNHKIVYVGKGATESKDGIDLGSKTNQNFVSIPYRKLLNLLKYKLKAYGIQLVEITEEYTSKTSPFADLNKVLQFAQQKQKCKDNKDLLAQIKQKMQELFNGERIKRGLFKDFVTSKAFNADAVGSYNILRKGFQQAINLGKKILIDKLARPLKLKLSELSKSKGESLVARLEIAASKTSRVLPVEVNLQIS